MGLWQFGFLFLLLGQCSFFLLLFFYFLFTFIDKTHITVAKFKTKRKYITILQSG